MNTAKIMSRRILLSELLENDLVVPEGFDRELTGIEMDSRQVEAGDLFFACKGATFDGRDFVDEVIMKGAKAVLVESEAGCAEMYEKEGVPIIPLHNLASRIGAFAARFFDHPARGFWLMGVTGTNGKTSCCQFVAECLTALNSKCGISGTIGYGVYGKENTLLDSMTTPDAIRVQTVFEELRQQGTESLIMEVSSHGLKQKRVNVSEFDLAIFTNLSRDHLDYHGSMEAYGAEKVKLFNNPKLKVAVVNLDDMFSATILNSLSNHVKSYTYSIHNSQAAVFAKKVTFLSSGFSLSINTPWGNGIITSSLLGSFNISNLLAAITAVMATESTKTDFNFKTILSAFSDISPVKGRMEIVGKNSVTVVIDYAHTPDGIKNALSALREHYSGKIWCVFGCGGDRDKGKRPLMAEAVENGADRVVVTNDNPRQESPDEIIQQIMSGISNKSIVTIESDRATAIEYAIKNADVSDVVLIAGKGHEEYQDIGGNRMVFSDVKQARLCLNKRFSGDEL